MASKQNNELSDLIISAIALALVLYACVKASQNGRAPSKEPVQQSQN
jgi:hypothetical protein